MHGEGATLALARMSERFSAAMRTSWCFKWRHVGEWFAENQPWSVPNYPMAPLGNLINAVNPRLCRGTHQGLTFRAVASVLDSVVK